MCRRSGKARSAVFNSKGSTICNQPTCCRYVAEHFSRSLDSVLTLSALCMSFCSATRSSRSLGSYEDDAYNRKRKGGRAGGREKKHSQEGKHENMLQVERDDIEPTQGKLRRRLLRGCRRRNLRPREPRGREPWRYRTCRPCAGQPATEGVDIVGASALPLMPLEWKRKSRALYAPRTARKDKGGV